jgi:hypothetical protein
MSRRLQGVLLYCAGPGPSLDKAESDAAMTLGDATNRDAGPRKLQLPASSWAQSRAVVKFNSDH